MKKPKKNIQDFGIFKKKNKYKKKALENFRICEKNLADSDADRYSDSVNFFLMLKKF